MKDEFLKRLPATATEERAMVEAAFGITGGIRQKKQEIFADARLSDAGKVEDVRKMATGTPLQHLRQIRQRAANMAADTKNARLAMQPKAPDRADLFGELQRRELRDHIRSLPEAERLRVAMGNPEMEAAVLNAPAMLSGLSPEQLDLVRDGHIERQFGEQLRAVEAREQVVETLDAAVRVATSQFSRETGLDETEIG